MSVSHEVRKDGEALTFRSTLVPLYVRKTRFLGAALPWLYLKGVSIGEMGEALKVLVGHDAGYTKQQIYSTLCPKDHSPKQKRPYTKYGRQRQNIMLRKPLNSSLKHIRINIQRPPFLYRKIVKS